MSPSSDLPFTYLKAAIGEGGLSMKTCIPALCAGFLALLATGTSVAQQSSPTLPSLDQTLLDIRVPGRVQAPNAGAGSQDQTSPPVDPMISLRRMYEEAMKTAPYAGEEETTRQPAPERWQPPMGQQLALSLASDKICVNGFVFNKADDVRAIESMKYLGGPPRACPRDKIADWIPLSQNSYSGLVKTARERVCQPWFGAPPAVCDVFR